LQNDLCYTSTEGTVTVTNVVNPGQTYSYQLEQNNAGLSFGLVNNHGNLGADQYTAVGWFDNDDSFQNIVDGFRDWNGVVTCVPAEECPEECGCGYTQGYWRTHCKRDVPGGSKCQDKDLSWPEIDSLGLPTEDLDVCNILTYYSPGDCGCPAQNAITALWSGFDSQEDSNAAVNLYRQFIAAALNTEKPEDPACLYTIDQVGGFARAAELLRIACNGGLSGAEETEANAIKNVMDSFNNGTPADDCGPEHCDGTIPPEECPEPPCEFCTEEGEIVPHGGQLLNHRDGTEKLPFYCLRLDQGADVYTYQCQNGDDTAAAYWQIYADGTLRVWGTVFGGKDAGEEYFEPKLCNISAHYTGFECCESPEDDGGETGGANDLCASGEGSGELTITCEGEDPVTWYNKARYDDINTVIGDFHRGVGETFSLFGWLQRTGVSGTQDWLAELTCQRQECPPEPPQPRPDDCGCGYTIGYWQSPRFVAEDEECTPWEGRIPSGDSNHDTCRWPALGGDSRENLLCSIPCLQHPDFDDSANCPSSIVPVTWWDILQNNYNSFGTGRGNNRQYPFSRDWYNTVRQAIAFELNRGIGFCQSPCVSDTDTQEQCQHLNGLSALVNQVLGACLDNDNEFLCPDDNPACAYFCNLVQHQEVLGEQGDGCKLYEILDLANNGDLGSDHCEDDDTDPNLRGCCAGRPEYASCVPDSLNHFNNDSEVTDCDLDTAAVARPANGPPSPPMQNGCDGLVEALENKEALEIATLVFVILAFLAVLILMIYLCVRARGGDSPLINIPFMSGGRATLADHVGGKVQ
jgi:hypothetical protein